MTLNRSKINLPASFIILLRDKFKVRHNGKWEPLLFSYNAKARYDMVSLVTNESPETAQILKDILWKMACGLWANCNLILGILSCTLPEDTIDMDLKVHTFWEIDTYRKHLSTQVIKCSTSGMEVKSFPSLQRKMVESSLVLSAKQTEALSAQEGKCWNLSSSYTEKLASYAQS